MFKKFSKNDLIVQNQMRTKLLFKHLYNVPKLNSIQLKSNFRKLKSFNDDIVLEGLFLLEFLGSLKANVSYYKKMYQEVNLEVSSILRKQYIYYFLFILKLFYFPLLTRRNVLLKESFDSSYNYRFTLSDVNSFIFLPDVYFKWNTPISCFFNLSTKDHQKSSLFLKYWNFPVYK